MAGWIKLDRKILEWGWYDDANTTRVFIHLLLTVNIEEKIWHGIVVKRGQLVSSYSMLAKRLRLTDKNIRTAISHLEQTGEVAKCSTPKYTVFTVINYDKFQVGGEVSGKQMANKWQTDGEQVATTKELKNIRIKEDKDIGTKVPCQQIADLYNQICISFPSCRTLSEARKKMINARLNTYSVEDIERAFTMAQESDFLKGANQKNWSANFDWMLKDANIAKILDGNYSNKDKQPPPKQPGNKNQFTDFEQRSYDVGELERRLLGGCVET